MDQELRDFMNKLRDEGVTGDEFWKRIAEYTTSPAEIHKIQKDCPNCGQTNWVAEKNCRRCNYKFTIQDLVVMASVE